MKAEQLEMIRKRAEKATSGPWHKGEYWTGETSVIGAPEFPINVCITLMEKDADFIAHAREDVPALIAEVERLGGKIGFYLDEIYRMQKRYDMLEKSVIMSEVSVNET